MKKQDKLNFFNKFSEGLGFDLANNLKDNVEDHGFFEFQIRDQSRVQDMDRAKNKLRAENVVAEDDSKLTLDVGQGEFMEVRFKEEVANLKLGPVVVEYSCLCKEKTCSCLDEAYKKGLACREKLSAVKESVNS